MGVPRNRRGLRRGTQVVRERSAKPLCVGSIPTRASNVSVASLPPSFFLSAKSPAISGLDEMDPVDEMDSLYGGRERFLREQNSQAV